MKHKENLEKYRENLTINSSESKILTRKSALFGWGRLVIAILLAIAVFRALIQADIILYGISALLFAAFVILVRKHRIVLWERNLRNHLAKINESEIDFLTKHKNPAINGEKWINPEHSFSYDLDVFGKESLFHHLNRTVVYAGSERLAGMLTTIKSNDEIKENQSVIKELSDKMGWRQKFSALGMVIEDKEDSYRKLIDWADKKPPEIKNIYKIVSIILSLLFVGLLVASLVSFLSLKWLLGAFVVNLFYFRSQADMIRAEVVDSENVAEIIQNYSIIIKHILEEEFESAKMVRLQATLRQGQADKNLEKLHDVFRKISGVNFDLAVLVLDGTILYHFHVLKDLIRWKKENAANLKSWLDIMAETDAFNSLANFSFNNKDYCYPELNTDFKEDFEQLGHPLIPDETRIDNDISLDTTNFMILTGSNMSGKSTFLRTLGVNMILGSIGAPVCARKADIHPLPILVSMRQTDSLSSGESYFFAEVKRLKSIIEQLGKETSLVLLDEILRGTNSDDKQSGTIGFIRKIISHQVVGGIATHDLEICEMTSQYPGQLQNKNFEVEIVDDELVFDYKLRDGVCQNKSATFLMGKMGII